MFNTENIPHTIVNMWQAGYSLVWIESAIRYCYPGLPEEFYLSIRSML
jgi:hypothetical protein